MRPRTAIVLLAIAVCTAACILLTRPGAIISPACAASGATAREVMIEGQSVGEVLLDDQVVFRIRTSAGGYTPFQRAEVVAERLRQLMSDSLRPEDVTTGRVSGEYAVLVNEGILITADPAHAELNDTTPLQLADRWAQQLENALAGRSVEEIPVAEKVVPIISVGSGTRIGGALVTGPRDRLEEVVAVAQLEGNFGSSVRVRALIPVSSEDVVQEIKRVPQTSVIGLVDIRL